MSDEIFNVDLLAQAKLKQKQESDIKKEKELVKDNKLSSSEVSDGKNLIVTDIARYEIFAPTDKDERYALPKQAVHLYGCLHCEWRGTDECPHKFSGGKVKYKEPSDDPRNCKSRGIEPTLNPRPLNLHSEGICNHRRWYLLTLSGCWSKQPSFSEWQAMFQRGRAEIVSSRDYQRYLDTQKELDDMELELKQQKSEQGPDSITKRQKEDLMIKRKEVYFARTAWRELAGEIGMRVDKQIDRETAKKVDLNVTKKSIPHEQILDIMRGSYKVEDAEVIEDET